MTAPTADLNEAIAELTARLHEVVEELADHQTAQGEQHDPPQPEPSKTHDQGEAPPHILTLTGERYREALTNLAKWVDGYLIPSYIAGRPVIPAAPRCPAWWLHPEAVARLEALWLAFSELTDPVSSGYTGRGTWFREHLDTALEELRSPTGPFARCMTDNNYPKHTEPEDLQVSRYSPPKPEIEPKMIDLDPDSEPDAVN